MLISTAALATRLSDWFAANCSKALSATLTAGNNTNSLIVRVLYWRLSTKVIRKLIIEGKYQITLTNIQRLKLWQTAPCYKEYNLTKPDPVWYNTSIKLCPSTSIQEIPFTTKRKCCVAWLVSCHGHTDWRHVLGRLTTRKNFPHPWPHCKPGFNPLIIGPVRLA